MTPIDKEIVIMYQRGELMKDIKAASGLTKKMVYKHLRANGVKPNRKATPKWTETEESQLVEARAANVTGQEFLDWIPTRTLPAIKGHMVLMGLTRGGV